MQRLAKHGTSGMILAHELYYKGLSAVVVGAAHFTGLQHRVYATPVLRFPVATALLCISSVIFSLLPRLRCFLSYLSTWRISSQASFAPTT